MGYTAYIIKAICGDFHETSFERWNRSSESIFLRPKLLNSVSFRGQVLRLYNETWSLKDFFQHALCLMPLISAKAAGKIM